MNYSSIYKKYANQSINWLPMDTEDLFLDNLKDHTQLELLKKHNWIDSNFTYRFNSNGFRCNEFTSDPTVMFIGCSHTIGIGLPEDKTWPYIVSKKLNMACANLGQGGGSADTAFRLCHGWIDQINPKIVVFLHPPGSRFEIINHDVIEFHSHGSLSGFTKSDSFIHKWIGDESNNYLNSIKNTLAINLLCNERKILFINVPIYFGLDKARDLCHAGVMSNEKTAEHVYNEIIKFYPN